MMLFTIIYNNIVSNTHLQKYSIIIILTMLWLSIRNFYMFVVESLCGVGSTVTHSTPMSECKQGGAEDTM